MELYSSIVLAYPKNYYRVCGVEIVTMGNFEGYGCRAVGVELNCVDMDGSRVPFSFSVSASTVTLSSWTMSTRTDKK
jgi:hypothetical protein